MSDPTDATLAEAGQRWRDAQPPPPDPDIGRFAGTAPGRTAVRRWVPVAALAGVVVAAILLVPLTAQRTGDRGAGPAASPRPTGREVPVEGVGTLLRDRDGRVRLCGMVISTTDRDRSGATCGGPAVPATGVDPRWLTHTTAGGQASSDRVRVEGTYREGTLAVTRMIGPAPADPYKPPSLPCPAPPGGWRPGYGLPGVVGLGTPVNADLEPVRQLVRDNADRFVEPWISHSPHHVITDMENLPPYSVVVVGTTDDPEGARTEAAARHPGNLCVHRTRFSSADLTRIIDRLRASNAGFTGVERSYGRVRVSVTILDHRTATLLEEVGRDALILEEPLLRWLE